MEFAFPLLKEVLGKFGECGFGLLVSDGGEVSDPGNWPKSVCSVSKPVGSLKMDRLKTHVCYPLMHPWLCMLWDIRGALKGQSETLSSISIFLLNL